MSEEQERETQEYLARIRRTIAESNRVMEAARLRMDETDRMLESHGLTRDQVLGMHFSQAQREAVDGELRRRGMEPVDWEDVDGGAESADNSGYPVFPGASGAPSSSDELAERQRKFGMMMKPFQI